MPHYESFEIDY